MKHFKLIFGILATLSFNNVNSKPLLLENSEYEEYAKNLNRINKTLKRFNVFNATKDTILEEFEDYFQGSVREQFISALNAHRKYFDHAAFDRMPFICGGGFDPKNTEIVEIIDKMVNVAKYMTDEEFDKALENIKAFGPLLINFYMHDLDDDESQALTKEGLKTKMSDFVEKTLLDEQEYQVKELRKMEWISKVPLEISKLDNELVRLFFQYDRKRYDQNKIEFKCGKSLADDFERTVRIFGMDFGTRFVVINLYVNYFRMDLFLKFANASLK